MGNILWLLNKYESSLRRVGTPRNHAIMVHMKQKIYALKPHLPKIIAGIVILAAVIVIIIISVTGPKKVIAPEVALPETPSAVPTTTSPSSKPQVTAPTTNSGLVVSTRPFIIPITAKASSSTDDAGDKHGTFSVGFIVSPGNQDILVSPSCYNEEGSTKVDGIAFSLIKDGTRISGSGLSHANCVILNRGTAEKDTLGNYVIKKGTQNAFELVVVNNPTDAGAYGLQITNIGYRNSATSIAQFFELSPETLQSLKTNTVGL
jgi:hypothetical protein